MMFFLFQKGGPVMYLLLLCSLVGLYIVVYQLLYLKVNRFKKEDVTDVKQDLVRIGKQATLNRLRLDRYLATKLMSTAIRLSGSSREDIEIGIKDATARELPTLDKGVNILSSIITVAPILGLLGTVLGLMDIFNVISGGGIGDASQLSGGIAEALITTVTGLSISIPFIFLNQYLGHKNDIFLLDLEFWMSDILTFCRQDSGVKP